MAEARPRIAITLDSDFLGQRGCLGDHHFSLGDTEAQSLNMPPNSRTLSDWGRFIWISVRILRPSENFVSGHRDVILSRNASSQFIKMRFRKALSRFLNSQARCGSLRSRFLEKWRLSLAAGGKTIGYRAKQRRQKWHENPEVNETRSSANARPWSEQTPRRGGSRVETILHACCFGR